MVRIGDDLPPGLCRRPSQTAALTSARVRPRLLLADRLPVRASLVLVHRMLLAAVRARRRRDGHAGAGPVILRPASFPPPHPRRRRRHRLYATTNKSTFHDDNICETRFSMLCASCLELTTENCSQ